MDHPSKLYSTPKTRFVADFIGHINQLEARVVESAHSHLLLSVAGLGEIVAPPVQGALTGDKGVFAIRPEQVRIGTHGEVSELKNHFAGEMRSLLYQGDVTVYKIALVNGATVEVLLPNSAPGHAEMFATGDAVRVGWRHDAGMFLHD